MKKASNPGLGRFNNKRNPGLSSLVYLYLNKIQKKKNNRNQRPNSERRSLKKKKKKN